MKSFLRGLLLFAATAFVACQKDSELVELQQKEILNISANIGDTRSMFGELSGNEYPSLWSGKETMSAQLVNGRSGYSSSAECALNGQAGTTAELSFAFDAPLPQTGFLYICSPAESISIENETFKVNVPTVQTPETYSVDPKAHILKAEGRYEDISEQGAVTFEHAVSYGRMTLTNLITTGNSMIDYVELTLGSKTYKLYANNVINKVFWFACDVNGSLNGMTITVVDKGKRRYVKTTSKKIEFYTGTISQFTVNMADILGSAELDVKPIQKADNIVVAHRGAVKEFGVPDNSLASLRKAIGLNCYGSECDIYWTKDNNVIVAHANDECKINGLYPWENTVTQLRSAGKLSNGENLPTLQEYIEVAVKEGKCTKLILDIKYIGYPTTLSESTRASYCINACRRAIEIAQSMKATEYIEFICTGYESVMVNGCDKLCETAKIPIGWMANRLASTYKSKSSGYSYAYRWANLSLEYMNDGILYDDNTTEQGSRTITEFVNNGITLSVYNVDTEEQMTYYINNASKLKCICTNYPRKLLTKMGKL